ncbi:MAG: hypothetical protein QOH20_278, partial [Mycobacterium sp.]|nr:hypothetical protein [Mycobacterium sp.]
SISFAACETLDDAVRPADEVGSALLDPASDVGDALVSADGSPLLAGAWLVSVLGATSAGEGGVDPADGGGETLVVTGADDGSGVALFSADVAGACSVTDGRAIRGEGGSALVAGALAAVVGATVEGLGAGPCVAGVCVTGACVTGDCVTGACV